VRSRKTVVISVLALAVGAIGVSPCLAQTRVTSLGELRRELAAGDFVTVVPAVGQPVAGRLMSLGAGNLNLRVESGPEITIALDEIQSLERPRDSARNGAALGAGIGAAFGGAMFVTALVIDRNEVDEWAPMYAGATAVCTGIGALLGWALDAAHSKPHMTFVASSGGRTTVRLQPQYSRGPGIALTVSFSR
jgi:hypothetical protein